MDKGEELINYKLLCKFPGHDSIHRARKYGLKEKLDVEETNLLFDILQVSFLWIISSYRVDCEMCKSRKRFEQYITVCYMKL